MKRDQENRYKMGSAVLHCLDKHSAIWTGSSAAVARRNALEGALGRVEAMMKQQFDFGNGTQRRGKAGKVAAKKKLAELAGAVASGVVAYGLEVKDYQVVSLYRRQGWKIFKMADVSCMDWCKLLKDFAASNIGVLGDYNIDASVVSELGAALDDFKSRMSDPRVSQGEVSSATAEIKKGLGEMLKILKWWDLFAGSVRMTQREFYEVYRVSRKTHNLGVRHVAVRGMVRAAGTGTPLYGVKVSVRESPHQGRTGKGGKYRVYSLQPGVYTLVFEKRGYETLEVKNVGVQWKEISEREVEMREVGDN